MNKTYRFGVKHTEFGFVDIEAPNEGLAREKAEEGGCENMEVNKCYAEIEELIEVRN